MLNVAGIGVFVVVLFVSIAVHEMMHAYTAYRLGDDLAHSHGRISLNPMNHIDPVFTIALPAVMLFLGMSPVLAAKPVPINTSRIQGGDIGLAAVGIAGPLTNLALATVAALVINNAPLDPGLLRDVILLFIELNVALFVFNMMPIPPLDGSRLLYAVAPLQLKRVMAQVEQMGMAFVIVMLVVLLPVLVPILSNANDFILGILL